MQSIHCLALAVSRPVWHGVGCSSFTCLCRHYGAVGPGALAHYPGSRRLFMSVPGALPSACWLRRCGRACSPACKATGNSIFNASAARAR